MLNKKQNTKGFTLIELLVVISIIALLSTIVLASLNTAKQKGRDTKRISDLKQLQTALELYKNEHGSYPDSCDNGWCHTCEKVHGINDGLQPLATEGFISQIPEDPLSNITNGTNCFVYEYISIPGQFTNDMNLRFACFMNGAWVGVANFGYVLRFHSESSIFSLPRFGARTNEYCVVAPD